MAFRNPVVSTGSASATLSWFHESQCRKEHIQRGTDFSPWCTIFWDEMMETLGDPNTYSIHYSTRSTILVTVSTRYRNIPDYASTEELNRGSQPLSTAAPARAMVWFLAKGMPFTKRTTIMGSSATNHSAAQPRFLPVSWAGLESNRTVWLFPSSDGASPIRAFHGRVRVRMSSITCTTGF